MEDTTMLDETSTTPSKRSNTAYKHLVTDMRAQNFDVIRFATYRTACKLRFIQKRTNLYLVDIWNIIEAFRENGLNTLEHGTELNITRVEQILTSIYFHLNKRLSTNQQIDVEESISLALNWLFNGYDIDGKGRVRVLSLKVVLSTLCSGKLVDKLQYVFMQISDKNGVMVKSKFEEYLKDLLAIPTAVYEGPSFGYNDTASRACFDGKLKITVNDFLDTLMSDPGPQCLMWLPILHRMGGVENVFHPVQCEGCHRESFLGFRYKCQRCYNYHLCQDCFWRGRTSGNHNNEHEVKEYSTYKSPAKQIGHSLRKSFRCVPAKSNKIPHFPEEPEKTLDLTHIVPPTPTPVHNGFPDASLSRSLDMSSVDSNSATRSPNRHYSSFDSRSGIDAGSSRTPPGTMTLTPPSTMNRNNHSIVTRSPPGTMTRTPPGTMTRTPPSTMNRTPSGNMNKSPDTLPRAANGEKQKLSPNSRFNSLDSNRIDDEHRLIARYAARLAADAHNTSRSPKELSFSMEASAAQRQLIAQLEAKNKEILLEIQRLRKEQEAQRKISPSLSLTEQNPTLLAELQLLRKRKDELEGRMSSLQESRRELMVQLEGLMKLLKNHGSPRSTPNSSPRSRAAHSPPTAITPSRSSLPSSPPGDSLMGVGGDVTQAFNQQSTSNARNLRNDLLVAADSVTNAMSSLVKELKSEEENSSGGEEDQDAVVEEDEIEARLSNVTEESSMVKDWQAEVERRLGQGKQFNNNSQNKNSRTNGNNTDQEHYITTDGDADSYARTDDELLATDMESSYIKTDDETNIQSEEIDQEIFKHDAKVREIYLQQRFTTDDEGYLVSDAESYIRTDDEEGGNTDWEDGLKRWVNR